MDRIALLQYILCVIYPFACLHVKEYLPPQVDDKITGERGACFKTWLYVSQVLSLWAVLYLSSARY
jgi:hypothetical protein